ncbi:PKD domain-containing protein [Reinekea forsetii]|nr:PKD domain-containing protein [Reinekea forsetii]
MVILDMVAKRNFYRAFALLFISSILLGCGVEKPSGTSSSPASPQEIAIDLILSYAEDGRNIKPVLQTYIDAGVVGVTTSNIDALNAVVDYYELDDVNTVAKLKNLVVKINNNSPPTVSVGLDEQVQLDDAFELVSMASDSDGEIVYFQWSMGATVLSQSKDFSYVPIEVGNHSLTLSVTDNLFSTTSATINLDVVKHLVNALSVTSSDYPMGTFWYVGNKKWEYEDFYECYEYKETAREESFIFLVDVEGDRQITIDLENKTIRSTNYGPNLEIETASNIERGESNLLCPSTKNDFAPTLTSPSEIEVNASRKFIVTLSASDKDLPKENLSFALTNNAEVDNQFFELSNFNENNRAACRAGLNDEGYPEDPNNSDYFYVAQGIDTLAQCKALCNEFPLYGSSTNRCKGIEFRAAGADSVDTGPRCEIWQAPIITTAPQPSYSCFTRETLDPTVLSFLMPPTYNQPQDFDVDNVYEVELTVFDGDDEDEDRKSSTSTLQVSVIPNGDYLGRAETACRAGYNNEGHPEDIYNSNYFSIANNVNSLNDCQALCDGYPLKDDPNTNCMGVEYRSEGADYADTQSRCELWKVPIISTTPQKEYACYARDLTVNKVGPSNEVYVGDYSAYYTDAAGHFAVSRMSLTQVSATELLWTIEGGTSWSVNRTDDRQFLQVGSDYPYLGDGHEQLNVFWNADEVDGITGPGGHIYRTAWAHAQRSRTQSVYLDYINKHPSNLVRVQEAQRQIRELKWAIAENLHTAAGYKAYKNDIGETAYGRTDEANRRIASFTSYVTLEVLSIEVDEETPAAREDNALELFYDIEFAIDYGGPLPGEEGWNTGNVFFNAQKISIDDGLDRAFIPAGSSEKTLFTHEGQTLGFGGLMFEQDNLPDWPRDPDCGSGICYLPGYSEAAFYGYTPHFTGNADYPYIYGVFDYRWDGNRTWAGGAAMASESLNHTYFKVEVADLEYNRPLLMTKSIRFESDELLRITYEITKRTPKEYEEHVAANTLYCDEPILKPGVLAPRASVSIDPPGFLIRNETDHTYSVSLNQVGPLYYGELQPGKIFRRDTAWGHFTIDVLLNFTGESRYDDWDVAAPIVQFTAEVLFTAMTAGSPITSLKTAITAGVSKVGGSVAARVGASALARHAIGRSMMRAGAKALAKAASSNRTVLMKLTTGTGRVAKSLVIDTAINETFTNDLMDAIYNKTAISADRTWSYSGAWPSTVGMYHIVGGPRLPCLNKDGDVEIKTRPLQILNDEQCAASSICTLH